MEYKGLKKDGTPVYLETSVSRILHNGKPASLVYTRNVSERRKAQKDLERAKQCAEAANRSKSEFLANMSHEIRIPLNGIMGVLNLLLSTDLTPEQLDLIDTGKYSADSLLTVINDILDFSKIEAGELEFEIINFNLYNAIEEVVALPAMMAHDKGLEFAHDIHSATPPFLRGDPGRLRQVLINLTNNAVKFTEKGKVLLNIWPLDESDTHVTLRFEVEDTGVGVPLDKQESIFEAFKQSDSSTTRKYGGTGLGLSISKRLIRMMGGEMGLRSEPGAGSIFWFTVPLEKQDDAEEQKPELPQDIKGKRFLLVNDNKTDLNIISGCLTTWGCRCDMAESGEIALTMMNAAAKVNAPFDAVILNMCMPGMDGAELGRRIKADAELKDIPMIMLASQGLKVDAAIMKKIGFAAYLTRPIRRSQFFDCLVSVLGSQNHSMVTCKPQIITKHSVTEERIAKPRILIAEDNAINQKLVLKMVEQLGFLADVAANGKEVLRAMARFRYDIVLMDVQMPEMDGLEASRRIRDPASDVLDHDIPLIAVTAHAMKGDQEICLEAGMNGYISKPVQPDELILILEKHLPRSLKSHPSKG